MEDNDLFMALALTVLAAITIYGFARMFIGVY